MLELILDGVKVKAVLVKWGIVDVQGRGKYLVGKTADGTRHLSTKLQPKYAEDEATGLRFARTESGSVYAVVKGGRDDEYAMAKFAEMDNDPARKSGGVIGKIIQRAKNGN